MTPRTAIDFVLLAAIWGASFLLMKLGAAEFGPFVTAFLRVFLASLFLLPLLLWGALVAWAWLGDRPNGSRVVGLVIGFVGVAALAWDKASFSGADPMSGLAVLACLTATLLYGIAASFTKKYLDGTPAMTYILFFRLITRMGPARTVTVTFLIPVFGVAYGSVLLSEAVTGSMLVFGAVIVLGTALATGVLSWPGPRRKA